MPLGDCRIDSLAAEDVYFNIFAVGLFLWKKTGGLLKVDSFRKTKKQMLLALLCIYVGLGGVMLGPRSAFSQDRPEYVPGEVLVKFREGIKSTVEKEDLIARIFRFFLF